MQYSLENSVLPIHKQSKLFIVYLFALLVPHMLFYSLITNLHNVTFSFAFLILYTFLMTFLFIERFDATIYLLYHLVFLLTFQNVLVGIGMGIFENQESGFNIKMLMIFKEVFAIIFVSLLYIRYQKSLHLLKFEKTFPLLVLWLGLSFVISSANMEGKLYYMRSFGILFVSYFLGRLLYYSLRQSVDKIYNVIKMVVFLGILSVIFGIIFLLIDNNSHIWKEWFHLGYIMQAKGTAYTDFPDFRTSVGPMYIYRMYSFFFDAINLSYFVLAAFCCTLFIKSKIMVGVRFFLLIGIGLTLGKGALAILAILTFWIVCLYNFKLKPKQFITFFVSFIFVAFFVIKGIGIKSSIIVHFDGFILPLLDSYLHPIGFGVGNGGVYYAMMNEVVAWDITHMGAESFMGSLIYQLGYPGFILYLVFFIGLIKYLLTFAYSTSKISFDYVLYSGLIFSMMTVSFFQEATLGLNYTGILTILCGFAVSRIQSPVEK